MCARGEQLVDDAPHVGRAADDVVVPAGPLGEVVKHVPVHTHPDLDRDDRREGLAGVGGVEHGVWLPMAPSVTSTITRCRPSSDGARAARSRPSVMCVPPPEFSARSVSMRAPRWVATGSIVAWVCTRLPKVVDRHPVVRVCALRQRGGQGLQLFDGRTAHRAGGNEHQVPVDRNACVCLLGVRRTDVERHEAAFVGVDEPAERGGVCRRARDAHDDRVPGQRGHEFELSGPHPMGRC